MCYRGSDAGVFTLKRPLSERIVKVKHVLALAARLEKQATERDWAKTRMVLMELALELRALVKP